LFQFSKKRIRFAFQLEIKLFFLNYLKYLLSPLCHVADEILDLLIITISLLAAIIAFMTTFLSTQPLMEKFRKVGIASIDAHKLERPIIPNVGGVTIVVGFLIGLISVLMFSPHPKITDILASIVTIFLMTLIGIIDDLTELTKNVKPLLAAFAAAPLIIIRVGYSSIALPFIGMVDVGLFYWYLVIPIGITAAANGFNSLAGFNGLEAGLGAIISFFLTLEALILGVGETALIMAAVFGACIAFLYYNRYPAKIFPGDTGTLTIGAIIASACIIGRMEWIGVTIFIPHIVNYGLILSTSGRLTTSSEFQPTQILPDGKLAPSPSMKDRTTLADLILLRKKMKEPDLVKVFWTIEIIFCIVSLMLALYYANIITI